MASKVLQRIARVALIVGGVAAFAAASANAARPGRRTARPRAASGFSLFAGTVNVVMNVNQVQCNVNNIGETCVDPTNSPVLGGGFWPRGTPDQYIFNGGLQIAAIVGGAPGSNPWAGDTVGAFFFDATGLLGPHGEGRTNTFNGLNADDIANWPSAAFVRDPTLFDQGLLGRKTASQQDTWVRYWDGNTNLVAGRQHPMGLLVEQRGLAWNFPSGNQDILYFLYRFVNITSKNAADYAGLASAGYQAADIAEIAAIGAEFQNRMESVYNIALPDGGVPFTNTFAAFGQDPDVGQAGSNYSNGNFPFALSFAYKANFIESLWQFPPSIFGAPFAAAPGFEGVKFLASPAGGIAVFTNSINAAGAFGDRRTVQSLWRLLSGNLIAADGQCSIPLSQVAARRFCSSWPNAADTRFYMSSGPYTLNPGESSVIVVAYVHAAPVAAMTCTAAQGACPGGAWSLAPLIGTDVKPGNPVDGTRLVSGLDTLRNVERAMGWLGHSDVDGDGAIEQNEVAVVRRSLFDKSLVAQAVFDNKFLLPFAPEAPTFFVVPGDNKVTVVWQPTATETDGDPFFDVASQDSVINPGSGLLEANPLYDPNFRKLDVEGYRVWRGRTPGQMEMIVQFDKSGTSFLDYTGAFLTSSTGSRCAPEIGVTASCPVGFNATFTVSNSIPLAGNVLQVPPGGRVLLANGNIFEVSVDTAVTGGGSGFPGLTDTGVPFVYEDNAVRNGFTYHYSVTAFDVNSVASGPSSLESPLVTKQVTPRLPASNPVNSEVWVADMVLGDGSVLNQSLPFPALNANGTLAGLVPPANTGSIEFLAFVAELLPPGQFFARVDSVGPGFNGQFGTFPKLYMTFLSGTTKIDSTAVELPQAVFNTGVTTTTAFAASAPVVPFDPVAGARFGISSTFAGRMPVQASGLTIPLAASGAAVSFANGRYGAAGTSRDARFFSSSYWFNQGSTPPANPTINPYASPANSAGQLTGVDSIFKPSAYRQALSGAGAVGAVLRGFGAAGAAVWYPADFVVTWNADSTISLRDSTHRTNLGFHTTIMSGYGFLNLDTLVAYGVTATGGSGATSVADGTGTPSMTAMSYHHLYATYPVCTSEWWDTPSVCTPFSPKAVLQQLDFNGDGVGDGLGIVLVINGEPFYMRMNALPAAGTRWRLTAFGGGSLTATCTPAIPASGDLPLASVPTSCTFASYTPPAVRPPIAPGLRFRLNITSPRQLDTTTTGDLANIHTVPDPYYVTNQLEITASTKVLRFVNLPHQAIIRIYSTSGILVNIVTHNNAGGGGEEVWNLRNRNNQFVASGVYFYHVETPDGRSKIGRFTVVNFAQ